MSKMMSASVTAGGPLASERRSPLIPQRLFSEKLAAQLCRRIAFTSSFALDPNEAFVAVFEKENGHHRKAMHSGIISYLVRELARFYEPLMTCTDVALHASEYRLPEPGS